MIFLSVCIFMVLGQLAASFLSIRLMDLAEILWRHLGYLSSQPNRSRVKAMRSQFAPRPAVQILKRPDRNSQGDGPLLNGDKPKQP